MSEQHAHGGHDSPEAIKKQVRVYLIVGAALLISTAITVALYSIHFTETWITVTIALVVATTKASLVAAYFMHLIDERKMIYTTLSVTAFFFAGLMVLTIWAMKDPPDHTIMRSHPLVSPAAVTAPAPTH